MSGWWWLPLGVGASGSAVLALLGRRLRREAAALRATSERLRRTLGSVSRETLSRLRTVFNLDPEKILVIGIFALVVLGPNRLPAAARNVGRVIGQLRRMSGSFQSEVRDALAEPRQALQHAVDEFGITEVRSSMNAVADTFRPSAAVDRFRVPSSGLSHPTPPMAAGGDPLPVPDDPSLN